MSQVEWISFAENESSSAQNIFGFLGNIFTLFFYLSPALKMKELISEKIDHTRIAYLQYVSSILCTILWFVYGLRRGIAAIYFCNFVGLVSNLIYLTVYFYYYAEKNKQVFQQYVLKTYGLLLLFFVIFMWGFESYEVAGICGMLVNIALYATPGQKIVSYFLLILV
jgi:hypothetical protein